MLLLYLLGLLSICLSIGLIGLLVIFIKSILEAFRPLDTMTIGDLVAFVFINTVIVSTMGVALLNILAMYILMI